MLTKNNHLYFQTNGKECVNLLMNTCLAQSEHLSQGVVGIGPVGCQQTFLPMTYH